MNSKYNMTRSEIGLRLSGLCFVVAVLYPVVGVCPRGAVEVTGLPGRCFSLIKASDSIKFREARQQCIKYEGKLYEPQSDEAVSKVETTFTFKFGPGTDTKWYWLGYAKIQYVIEGSWDSPVEEPYWGSISTFEKKPENFSWAANQPDDIVGQFCTQIKGLESSALHSVLCNVSVTHTCMCEFSLSTYRSG
ncbi:uncharacterized protein LOC142348420 isoform X2 [Convolutriloba macropyga]|uniref:uncharacterized protein LOC142348420 isoform X2 n=1 Tax=Convolutriloba macropyga TaxID=536237 RepID=UPI003F525C6E